MAHRQFVLLGIGGVIVLVVALTLKKARMGAVGEYALRLLEVGGKPSTRTRVKLPQRVSRVFLADQAERKGKQLALTDRSVHVTLTANRLLTLRLDFRPGLD